MGKIQLYIAVTIDGFIARENGSLDWLDALPNPTGLDHGYATFFAGVDTVVMGRKTYEEILGFGVEWPYSTCKAYVVTQDKNYQIQTKNTILLNELNTSQIELLKAETRQNIWVVGGGSLITHLLNLVVIDEMILCLIPTILSKGIKLFPDAPKETSFSLLKAESFPTGVVNLTYQKR